MPESIGFTPPPTTIRRCRVEFVVFLKRLTFNFNSLGIYSIGMLGAFQQL